MAKSRQKATPIPLLPLVCVQVRLTTAPTEGSFDLEVLEPLKKALHAVVAQHAAFYGYRVKRRVIATEALRALYTTYEARATAAAVPRGTSQTSVSDTEKSQT